MDEPAIRSDQASIVRRLNEMETVIRASVLAVRASAAAEDLFCTSAVNRGRPSLAIDKDHIVTFAVPSTGNVIDLEQQPDHLTTASGVERDVILRPIKVHSPVELHVRLRSDGN